MGFFKKVFRPIRKVAKKIIPKEIRPALPFLASAAFGPAGMFANVGASGMFANAALRQALAAGITSAATDEDGNPLRAAGLAAAPALLSQGVGALAGSGGTNTGEGLAGFLNKTKTIRDGDKIMQTKSLVERAQALAEPSGFMNTAKVVGGQAAIDQSAKFAEIRQDEIDEYNRNLLEQGVASKVDRRKAIFGIFKNAGYDDDYVNKMLDTYGYAGGGRIGYANGGGKVMTMEELLEKVNKKKDDDDDEGTSKNLSLGLSAAMDGVQKAYGRSFGEMEPVEFKRFAQGGDVGEYKDIPNIFNHSDDGGIMNKISESMERDYDYFTRIKMRENLKQGETMEDAADLSEQEAMDMVMNKYTKGGFARGGEVEVEEQTEDLGIRDLMRDQGVEYGEQVSNAQNDELLEKLFEEFLDLGFSPEDAAKKAREAFDDMSQGQGIKGTQVASGYKNDIEEMYEQYVFEMEEQGLQPMDFAAFLRQAKAGMASGGRVNYAGGGASYNSSGRYSFLIGKYNKGIPLSPSEADELEMLEMTYADESKGRADGGIMNKNLLNTGVDKDMRGGGFIPEGTKEKADDVPARLSKNEFVMTADAVRAAGGGSVNEGAKRMYDAMHKLEAKV